MSEIGTSGQACVHSLVGAFPVNMPPLASRWRMIRENSLISG
jgi:hypothetical protein